MIAGAKAAGDEADDIDIMLVRSSQQPRGRARVTHAVVVIFLEFFAWGLLTTPMLTVLHETFPQHTFLMNGLVQGVKGFLSFLSAPVIGALSDIWGRKSFLLMTVFFTCAPIPFMRISPWWYFALIAVSGVFAVTFSVVFAYVADITDEHRRSTAYGLVRRRLAALWATHARPPSVCPQVSATFAASLVTSPAIGAYLSARYGDSLVVLLATVIAVADIAFVFFAVPESLADKMRPSTCGPPFSWEQADPFASLRRVGKDSTVMLICVTVFLSYLPEAGQYSSFFLYLRQVIDFSPATIAAFIAMVGILSIIAQDDVGGGHGGRHVLHHLPGRLGVGFAQRRPGSARRGPRHDHGHPGPVQRFGSGALRFHLLSLQRGTRRRPDGRRTRHATH
ncbi:hippocampus abundant transcript-like protein 1 isoform X7 [Vanacampus margaritifer]